MTHNRRLINRNRAAQYRRKDLSLGQRWVADGKKYASTYCATVLKWQFNAKLKQLCKLYVGITVIANVKFYSKYVVNIRS